MPRMAKTSAMPDSLYVYCTAILSHSNYDFTIKSDRNAFEVAIESTTILTSELQSTVAKIWVAEVSITKTKKQFCDEQMYKLQLHGGKQGHVQDAQTNLPNQDSSWEPLSRKARLPSFPCPNRCRGTDRGKQDISLSE